MSSGFWYVPRVEVESKRSRLRTEASAKLIRNNSISTSTAKGSVGLERVFVLPYFTGQFPARVFKNKNMSDADAVLTSLPSMALKSNTNTY